MKCCLCGKDAGKYGNNAEPVKKGQCCDLCNATKVITARIEGKVKKMISAKALWVYLTEWWPHGWKPSQMRKRFWTGAIFKERWL